MPITETIQRNIYFYRAETDTDSDGSSTPFDAKAVLTALNKMAFDESDGGRYADMGNGLVNLVFVDKLKPNPSVKYATVRHRDLPTIEKGGAIKPLGIAADEGICEPIHVVFFENNIVGAEFNFYGPRLTGLASYLRAKMPANLVPRGLRFGMLLKNDPMAALNQLSSLKLMELKIRASHLEELKALEGNNPFAALADAAEFGKADTIDVVLQAGRKRDSFLSDKVRRFVAKLIKSEKYALADTLLVKGLDKDTGHTRTFDLLAEHLISTKQMIVIDDGYRAVKSESAYFEITAAYNENRVKLEHAPSA